MTHTSILSADDHAARAVLHQEIAAQHADKAVTCRNIALASPELTTWAEMAIDAAAGAKAHGERARFHLFAAIDMRRAATIEAECAATDKAWSEAYEPFCPRGMWPGDFRYTDAAKGEPGTALRAAYDARCRAFSARAELRNA